jgi:dipeptidyl aminopeptidase/acylaminoacyl peptidase
MLAHLALLLALAAPAPADDAGRIRSATEFKGVAISPDARHLAWVETVPGPEAPLQGKAAVQLLSLQAEGAKPLRVTAGDGQAPLDEGSIAWSPDSQRLAFLSDAAKAGQLQLYVADVAGGAPRKLTDVTGGVAAPRWSPDGKRIAFLFFEGVNDLLGPTEVAPRQVGVIDELVRYQRIAVVPAEGGAIRQVSPPDLHVYEADWAPDGRAFAAVGAHGPGDQSWWTAALYTIPAAGGPAALLYQPKLQIAQPRWSPDGASIALVEGLMSDADGAGGDVTLVPAAGGPARNLTPGLRASVGVLHWTGPDEIAFVAWRDGESSVGTLRPSEDKVEQHWRGPEHLGNDQGELSLSLARDGTAAAASLAFERGAEIFVGPLRDRAGWQQRTHSNEGLPIPWRAPLSLHWKSDGLDVQGWLLLPRAPAASLPLIVMAHGGPSWAHGPKLSPLMAELASHGYALLLPNPRGSYGQGEAFVRANMRDFGGGDLRDILAGVDAALQRAPLDAKRIGLHGWSYAGFLGMWAPTQTDRFRAVVAGAGVTNWQSYYGTNRIDTWMIPFFGASVYDDPAAYRRCSALELIKKIKTPTLLLHGERDSVVSVTQSFEHWHALKVLGVPTQLVVYPDEGHSLRKPANQRDVETRAREWFDRYLAAPAATTGSNTP